MHTLLLADDSITVQRVIALTFAAEPIHVVAVSDGQQAMETIAVQRPDVILAATTLSKLSGYDLARFVRNQADLQEVPVLLLSGAFETVDEAKLKASGANGVIEKPVEPIAVIARVKELLGFKSAAKPAPAGRLVTPADGPEKTPPPATVSRSATAATGAPSNWEQLREQTGLAADTRSVEAPSARSGTEQHSFDVAFDSLDEQLSGRAQPGTHNPSGPLGHAGGAADPRSPGRRPDNNTAPGNPVFEVDDEWFGAESRAQADARAGRREISEDLRSPELQMGPTSPESAPIFEVDDEWFADGGQSRGAKLEEQRQLAAEMGIYDVDLPKMEAPLEPAPVVDGDLEFSLDDLTALEQDAAVSAPEPMADATASSPEAPPQDLDAAPEQAGAALPSAAPEQIESAVVPEPVTSFEAPAPIDAATTIEAATITDTPAPVEPIPPTEPVAAVEQAPPAEPVTSREPVEPVEPSVPATPVATIAELKAIAPPTDPSGVADDFAALLAYEQSESDEPPVPPAPPPQVEAPAPQITEEMLDQIASRVAERLSAGLLGEQLRAALTDTVQDTVREIVSETSERLVRDEIDRIRGQS